MVPPAWRWFPAAVRSEQDTRTVLLPCLFLILLILDYDGDG